jgi:predicted RND superfamily exporter protein
MDNQQIPATPVYQPGPPPPGMFGTKIPSSVSFVVAVLLFFMPFIDIKCNNMSLQTVSGIQLATGFKLKESNGASSFMEETVTKTTTKTDKKDPNLYAMVALGLGVLGLLLSFTNAKAAIGGAMVTGIASAGALIGLMLDIKKKIKLDTGSSGGNKSEGGGFDDFGKELTEKMNISVDFTPWFYVAVVAFLAAAFFCYKRMSSMRS